MFRPLRALVIDPNPAALTRTVRRLDGQGFRIAVRTSPEGAAEYVTRTRPDVILLAEPLLKDGWGPRLQAASSATQILPVPLAPGEPEAA